MVEHEVPLTIESDADSLHMDDCHVQTYKSIVSGYEITLNSFYTCMWNMVLPDMKSVYWKTSD